MNLKLHRTDYLSDGIFGTLTYDAGKQIAVTLEHSYDSGHGNGSYLPKIVNGTYKCVRGLHTLEHRPTPFETFEITKVPNHTNILFHVGNFNKDSDGCCLLGQERTKVYASDMITNSRITFDKFMELLKDVNEFTLTVT